MAGGRNKQSIVMTMHAGNKSDDSNIENVFQPAVNYAFSFFNQRNLLSMIENVPRFSHISCDRARL